MLGPGTYPLTATVAVPALVVAEGAPLEAWLRLSVAEAPAPAPQDGRGPAAGYDVGETEDYLLSLAPTLELSTTTVGRPAPTEPFAYTMDLASAGNVVAAGAVLICAVSSAVIGLIVFIPYLK